MHLWNTPLHTISYAKAENASLHHVHNKTHLQHTRMHAYMHVHLQHADESDWIVVIRAREEGK